VENLEEEHSTRNARFMRMMEDMHVVENRGSGISAMLQATREANLEPPRFDDRRTSFLVTFRNHTLMNPQAIAWLNQFAHVQLNDRQRLALVYLHQHEFITNADYRRLNRVDAMVAGQELRGLVQAGMIDQHGASRGTSYTLRLHYGLHVNRRIKKPRLQTRKEFWPMSGSMASSIILNAGPCSVLTCTGHLTF
jgi:ATP-dependent DNA helicase RecG